tara:strand:+ start:2281 stop:3591 length:1311 start_codon:yes stop_codon:yes gene_type:complete
MSISLNHLRHKNFAIYGLGVTGRSVINYFHKHGFENYIGWDDDNDVFRKSIGPDYKIMKRNFLKVVNFVDYIIISPGIKINKAKLKKILLKNKKKIITDLDLFYLINQDIKSIVVTGTNGKSTTCKVIEHVLKKNNINVGLGGNIGSPVLKLDLKKNSFAVIEASSFQLAYSKFIKPYYAIILNITKDHLDWHGSMTSYVKSKLKIFSLQDKDNFALINSKKILKKFRKNKYMGQIKFVDTKRYEKIRTKIANSYLNLEVNEENMSFVYALSKILKIKETSFIKSLNSFKGLNHRHEVFYKKNNKTFINDSKATSFAASKFALKNNQNILWIVGGLPKIGDKFHLEEVKKNIIRAYIIGKHKSYFKKLLNGKVKYELCKTLKNAIDLIFKYLEDNKEKKITILLSPASASYDQFKNFGDRGEKFKKLIKNYIKKYF